MLLYVVDLQVQNCTTVLVSALTVQPFVHSLYIYVLTTVCARLGHSQCQCKLSMVHLSCHRVLKHHYTLHNVTINGAQAWAALHCLSLHVIYSCHVTLPVLFLQMVL